ncbi:hypothetical protein COY87_05165 [Candidatus Roizmanbacteria bacterium CG_4_10_14_0_8_um_filter_33_9]|uniref:Nudix hydrolase domain-containing protein n=1 Tax=Candidatus Roizmanbacteria bacterium CG_4_10_14_0_8_um_filter_33_9 TaxID=1974826 RepID=A0A2M7QH26_9BACT|nr:MAG: hypothetical protein COY87_05165 [Candidatus Roizmanbacteria bacterium CG_4_10_14_0_8_um_filter_33_9]
MKKPKTIDSRLVYSDSYINIIHDILMFKSRQWNQVYLDKVNKNSVVIVPVEKDGVYLIKQYRHPVNKFLWQFPAGTYENKLNPLQLAKKELREETGMTAQRITKIGTMFSEPGLSTDKTTIFVAEALSRLKKQTLDQSEIGMEVCFFKFEIIMKMIRERKIKCGITLSAYLLYLLYSKKLIS